MERKKGKEKKKSTWLTYKWELQYEHEWKGSASNYRGAGEKKKEKKNKVIGGLGV